MSKSLVSVLVLVAVALPATARAQGWADPEWAEQPRWRMDGLLTLTRFEQQVKTEVGGAVGERLVEATEAGVAHALTARVWGPFQLGAFMVFNGGNRRAGRFVGFDDDDGAVVADGVGGPYYELWAGPLLRFEWYRLFAELGYGAYGTRHDAARDDLPSETGVRTGRLTTDAAIAWMIALGGTIPITDRVEVVIKAEYRIRYYDRRGGTALADGIVHGTQSFAPFVGVAWRFGSGRSAEP